jgi:hypothetical protein
LDVRFRGQSGLGKRLPWSILRRIANITRSKRVRLGVRNVNTRQFEVYDIVNNQITSAFNIGAVGLDFQLGGFAVDPPTVSGTFTDISSDQLAQNDGFWRRRG